MAKKNILDSFKCPVCLDLYTIPKLLHCGHSVCEKCLSNHIEQTVSMAVYDIHEYIQSNKTEVKPEKQHFNCPVEGCKKEIQPSDPVKRTSKWACQFENNLKLMSLLDICLGTRMDNPKYCDMCINIIEKGKPRRILATTVCVSCMEKLCVDCGFIHKHVYFSHKEVYNINALENTTSSIEPTEKEAKHHNHFVTTSAKRRRFCPLHSAFETILYCLTCKEECCSKCRKTIHESCEQIKEIESLYKEKQDEHFIEALQSRLRTSMENVSPILATYASMLEDVGHLRSEQVDTPTGKTTEQLSNANENSKQESETITNAVCLLESNVHRCELIHEHLDTCLSNLNGTLARKTETGFVRTVNGIQEECEKLEIEVFKLLDKLDEMKTTFDILQTELESSKSNELKDTNTTEGHSESAAEYCNLKHKAGCFECECIRDFSIGLGGNTFGKRTIIDGSNDVEMVTTVSMKSETDVTDCFLTGCIMLKNGSIIVADNANKKLKWTNDDKTIDQVVLESAPWGLTVDEQNKGCVTLPNIYQICFFEIADGRVSIANSVKTLGKCYGIDFVGGNIVVSCEKNDSGFISILNIDGIELRNIHDSDGVLKCPLFKRPAHIKVVKQQESTSIFVSDFKKGTVTTLKGSLLEEPMVSDVYFDQELNYPTGIDVDSDGSLLVCSSASGNVQRISVLGDKAHVIVVKHVFMPRSVSFGRDSNTFVLTVDSGPMKNSVIVYRVKNCKSESGYGSTLNVDDS